MGAATALSAANARWHWTWGWSAPIATAISRAAARRQVRAKGSFLAHHWHISYTLILITVAIYGLQQIIPNEWVVKHGSIWWPYVQHGEYYRIISYGFLHSQNDPMHLVWNVINLFIYGVSLERMMGRWKFLFVYLGSIVFGAIGVYVLAPATSVVGASGGILA